MTQKQVAVIGGGVIGVCTAYFLARAGHEVVVIERHHNVGQEASYGSASLTACGHAAPWAAPGMPRRIFSRLLSPTRPVVLKPRMDRAQWRWVRKWLDECEAERYRINRARMQRLALYSREVLQELREQYTLDCELSRGVLCVFRDERERRLAEPAIAALAEGGIAHRLVDESEARAIEPALGYRVEFAGGLYLPDDESGNCPLFTKQMRYLAQSIGVHFHFTTTVHALESTAGRVTLRIEDRSFDADAVVVAAGADSARLLLPLGIHVPLHPVHTCAATVPIRNFEEAPRAAVIDDSYRSIIMRMGHRIRIAGTAGLGLTPGVLHKAAMQTLLKVGGDWFPNAANYNGATFWSGVQSMLPDGPPLLGATPVKNVYLNLGHGSHGWAMALGSGKAMADVVSGAAPDIDLDGLTLSRYG